MGLMGIISMLIVGLVVGALGRFFYPGAVPMGWIGTIVLGIVGSFVGGVIGSLFSRGKTGIQPAGLLLSIVGAVVALWVYINFLVRA